MAGKVAERAESRKRSKYQSLDEFYDFRPVAVETLGPWGSDGRTFIKEIGDRIRVATGEPRSKSFLFQRISVAIQRGNAASILLTLPVLDDLREVFYLL